MRPDDLGLGEDDLREIWAELCSGVETATVTRGELIRALGDPELQALLVVSSRFGNTARGEQAVMELCGDPQGLVDEMLSLDLPAPGSPGYNDPYDVVTYQDFRRCLGSNGDGGSGGGASRSPSPSTAAAAGGVAKADSPSTAAADHLHDQISPPAATSPHGSPFLLPRNQTKPPPDPPPLPGCRRLSACLTLSSGQTAGL